MTDSGLNGDETRYLKSRSERLACASKQYTPRWCGMMPKRDITCRVRKSTKWLLSASRQSLRSMRPSVRLFSRSAWKGPYFVTFPNLRESIARNIPIYTQARACTVLPNFVGAKFMIHNGKTYLPVTITQEMVGHKLGEFAPTRKPFSYKPSQKGK